MADESLVYYLQTVGCDGVTAAAVVASAKGVVPFVEQQTVPCVKKASDPPADKVVSVVAPTVAVEESVGWEDLALQVAECSVCALSAARTRTVFGSGDAHADLLLIGEAPRGDEEQQGEPFVGREGRLLKQMLAAIHLSREQVQVINVVKCHPPQNRAVKPQELAACRHFIDAQIALVQPKVIVLLGSVAACAMLGQDVPLSVSRRRWYAVQGIPAYVTYHPAFLLRSQQQKVEGWQDLLQIQARLVAESAMPAASSVS
ncbi:MAG: uracil-DNA glycosylase [Mariprofundales bacterium]